MLELLTMSLTPDEVKKIAHLARINVNDEDILPYAKQLSRILAFIEQMNTVNTATIEPLAHPLDLAQPLRSDQITETDLRAKFQKIAPEVEAGLYLVPKVIDEA